MRGTILRGTILRSTILRSTILRSTILLAPMRLILLPTTALRVGLLDAVLLTALGGRMTAGIGLRCRLRLRCRRRGGRRACRLDRRRRCGGWRLCRCRRWSDRLRRFGQRHAGLDGDGPGASSAEDARTAGCGHEPDFSPTLAAAPRGC